MSDGMMTFSFGDGDSHIGDRAKVWKAEGGSTYRLSFAWWKEEDESGRPNLGGVEESKDPMFSGGPTNFLPGLGYVLNNGAEYTKLAGNQAPRMRIATVIIIWPTTKKGDLDTARVSSGDFEVKPWVFGQEKYRQLETLHTQFSFAQHDVLVKCEDTQYQKMTFTPCKEQLYRKLLANPKAASHVDRIVADVKGITGNIAEFVGRQMTIQQIREKLVGSSMGTSPLGDMAAVSGDVDSFTSSLLDE